MWYIEKIYNSNGAELTNPQHTTTLANAKFLAFDGQYVWVTVGTSGLGIYQYYGANTDDEPTFEQLCDLDYANYDSGLSKKLRLVTFFTLASTSIKRTTCVLALAESGSSSYPLSSGETAYTKTTAVPGLAAVDATYITKCGTSMFVTGGASFTKIYEFDIATQAYVRTIDVTETVSSVNYPMNSNLASSNDMLWFAGSYFDDLTPQKMYWYDPATSTKNGASITVRPSTARTWIASGYNGYVYYTNYNNVSISKYDDTTGAFVTSIRTNALPTRVYSDTSKRILVSSYAGMLTLVDWDDDQAHNSFGTETDITSCAYDPSDGSKIWFIRQDGVLVRYDANDIEQYDTEVGDDGPKDWSFDVDIPDPIDEFIFTPTFTYVNGSSVTITVEPYFFAITTAGLYAWRQDRYFKRPAFGEMGGQAAVAGGSLQYFGET